MIYTPDHPSYSTIHKIAEKDARYRKYLPPDTVYTNRSVSTTAMRYSLPCIHEGAIIEWCHTCNGENRHVRECDMYGQCTRGFVSHKVRACVICSKQESTPYRPNEELFKAKIQKNTKLGKRTRNKKKTPTELLKEFKIEPPPQPITIQPTDTPSSIANPTSEEVQTMEMGPRRLLLKRNREELRKKAQEEPRPTSVHELRKIKPILSISKLKPNEMTWATGITTVPSRRTTTLPRTIQSLIIAGFNKPQLFIDVQDKEKTYLPDLVKEYQTDFGLEFTIRNPNIRTFGNWFLALLELYIRNPHVNRYTLFQDDVIACNNLREYLEHCEYPQDGYLNLITYPQNEREKHNYFKVPERDNSLLGWYPSNQMGKGAQGLVFDRKTVLELIGSDYLLKRPQEERGHQNIDGGISTALKKKGYTEYVHSPSLIRHIGKETTIYTLDDKGRNTHPIEQPSDESFRGEDWNALEMIERLT